MIDWIKSTFWDIGLNRLGYSPTRILPTGDGGVLIEWNSGDAYLEAEINTGLDIEWMLDIPGHSIEHGI